MAGINYDDISLQVGQVFTPNIPIGEKEMFSGRIYQIRKTIDVIFQRGQHAIIFGDRGVGKTSLANVLSSIIPKPSGGTSELLCVRVNCDTVDDFSTVWKKVFDEMQLIKTVSSVGFLPEKSQVTIPTDAFLPDPKKVIPDHVRKGLAALSEVFLPVIIIDEFDRLQDSVKRLFSDLIKSLSDHAIQATVVLIGVGDSVEQLVKEHESVSRALVQINMPRMNQSEVKQIIENGLQKLGMTIDSDTLYQMAALSKGLPHYAHLIGKHAARTALDLKSLNITNNHFKIAIETAINDAQHSIRTAYHNAIRSTKKINLFSDVILACAMSDVNELGEFAAQDLREPMKKITGKNYDIAAYARHLDEFSSESRGKILIKSGATKRFRYKFRDPLMQSFVIMQGILAKKIDSP